MKPFSIDDKTRNFNGVEFAITPRFFQLLMKGNKIDFTELTDEEKNALVEFIGFAGGFRENIKSNIHKAVKYITHDVAGSGTSFVFCQLIQIFQLKG